MKKATGKVGIIGGGLGGLASACTLAARGYDVTLYEKSPWLGGKAAVLESGGYRFDMGPTILTLPSVLRRIFAEAGQALDDALPMTRLDPQWRSFFTDGSTLDLVADRKAMTENIAAFSHDAKSAPGYGEFLDFSKHLDSVSQRFFFWRSLGSMWDMLEWKSMFQIGMLRDVLKMRLGKTVARCIRSHVPDERVAQMLDHFTQYVGSAPDQSPAVLCGIAHMQTDEGVWYPEGGTRGVPVALAKLADELGVEVHNGVGVSRILLDERGAVAGLETETGEQVPFDAVISNCDSVRTHRELLAGTKAERRFEKRDTYEAACSGVVLYLGLEQKYDHLLHHNFVFSNDAEAEFEAIYRQGEPAEDMTCYVCAPACTDASVAPEGGEALYVLVHTPYLRPHHNWEQMFPVYRDKIVRKLKETAGLEDIEERIRYEGRLTPQDIHDRYRVLNGAIYGLASHGRFNGAFKPANRSKDVPGLYLAGGAAHPGPGMPMVLMSGWIAADTLDQDEVVQPRSQRRADLPHPRTVAPHAGSSVATESALRTDVPKPSVLEKRSPWLVRWFVRYAKRYLRKNFHAVRLAKGHRPSEIDGPLVVVLNHPSWWDPLMGMALADELFSERSHYVPFDADAMAKYRFFEKLGFFGVEQNTRRGALEFLRTGQAVLEQPGGALWITVQGRFADPRERPMQIRPGVGHLLARLERGVVLPLALEYPFWEERYPEALACFGSPIPIEGANASAQEWTQRIESSLATTQDVLRELAVRRDRDGFEILLGGNAGVGGTYDIWRRLKAWWSGKSFDASHGEEDVRATVPGSAEAVGGSS